MRLLVRISMVCKYSLLLTDQYVKCVLQSDSVSCELTWHSYFVVGIARRVKEGKKKSQLFILVIIIAIVIIVWISVFILIITIVVIIIVAHIIINSIAESNEILWRLDKKKRLKM